MNDETLAAQFHQPQLQRLRALADLGDPMCSDDLADPRVVRRLAEVEVLLTSWGCPPLTPDWLARAPRLRAIFHCAATPRR